MNTTDLQPGDWITIPWIPYKLYVIKNQPDKFSVCSPSWFNNSFMSFDHWRFEKRGIVLNKKGHRNVLYTNLTKHIKFIHPYI